MFPVGQGEVIWLTPVPYELTTRTELKGSYQLNWTELNVVELEMDTFVPGGESGLISLKLVVTSLYTKFLMDTSPRDSDQPSRPPA